MNTPNEELFPFLEKFIKKGKVRFPGQGVMIVEGELEELLLLIEKLDELGIPLKDCLDSVYREYSIYREGGNIMTKSVRLYIFPGGKARIVPGKPVSGR